jgi:DNA-directed RNA polymerase specialized sigma24 family protein
MSPSGKQPSPTGRRWELSAEAFEKLLRTLDPDRDRASRRYETLRRKLIDLFTWEHYERPEELADETLNRLAKRLSEGVSVEGSSADRYAFGIARFLMKEETRSRRSRDLALKEIARLEPHRSRGSDMLHALTECLDALPPDSRKLLEQYYTEDRTALASSLDISLNALRNRVMRLRERLYNCVVSERERGSDRDI